ncbi:retrovirus-related pol polyprotein from transposon TNT 1-94 [Tanacetum coccineum]
MPMVVPISTREPKRIMNQSVATPLKRIVASESTNQKHRSKIRKQYEHICKTCKWWYPKFTPSGYKWKPKSPIGNVNTNLVEIILFIIESGCLKHMTRNLKLLSNFMEKFLGTVKFRNDQIALILGYGDLVQGTITIKRVYYVEGLNHNLFSVGQFCSRGTDLYSITLQDTSTPNPICLMAKATSSQAWLWHRRLSHLNFDSINLLSKNDIVIGLPKLKFVKDHLCSFYELWKAKRKCFHTKITPSSKRRLQLLHVDLCGPMQIYLEYSLLDVKDETPEATIAFPLKLAQRGLHAQVRTVRTDKGLSLMNFSMEYFNVLIIVLKWLSILRDTLNIKESTSKSHLLRFALDWILSGYSLCYAPTHKSFPAIPVRVQDRGPIFLLVLLKARGCTSFPLGCDSLDHIIIDKVYHLKRHYMDSNKLLKGMLKIMDFHFDKHYLCIADSKATIAILWQSSPAS